MQALCIQSQKSLDECKKIILRFLYSGNELGTRAVKGVGIPIAMGLLPVPLPALPAPMPLLICANCWKEPKDDGLVVVLTESV